jgi:hypothetical protein
MVPRSYPPSPRSTYLPAGGPVSDEAIPPLFGGGVVMAEVEVPAAASASASAPAASGVLFALGDHTNGFAAFVDAAGRLSVALSVGGDLVEARADVPVPGGPHQLGLALVPLPPARGTRLEARVDGQTVAAVDGPHAIPYAWQHGGTSLFLGFDRGFPVSPSYQVPGRWTGRLHRVVIEAGPPAQPPVRPPAEALRETLAAE